MLFFYIAFFRFNSFYLIIINLKKMFVSSPKAIKRFKSVKTTSKNLLISFFSTKTNFVSH